MRRPLSLVPPYTIPMQPGRRGFTAPQRDKDNNSPAPSAEQLEVIKQRARQRQMAVKPPDASGWRCNAYQSLHAGGPSECADPHKGGHWETGASRGTSNEGSTGSGPQGSLFGRVSDRYRQTSLGRSPAYSLDATVNYVNAAANGVDNYGGRCASAVANAIEAGGVKLGPRPNDAKDFGPLLQRAGFRPVRIDPASARPGDVAIFQSASSGRQNGHAQMFNGRNWVSDTVQSNFLPSRSRYGNTAYTIYRYVR